LRFLLLFSFLTLYALELNVDYTKNKKPEEILTITNDTPFICSEKKHKVICVFEKIPSTPVFKTDTVYFKIKPLFKNSRFILSIDVKGKYFIKSFEDSQYANVSIKPSKSPKKWVIIAGSDGVDQQNRGLAFFYVNSPKPYIGAIDENSNPITINNRAKDVIKYFEILHSYEKGKDVLEEIDRFVKDFPNSVFVPDVLYLKLKILDQENRPDDVIALGKKWIKTYSFNENLPKVLLLIAKNYTKLGFMSDASYFYQRIITEYPKSKSAFLAMIYWADQMYITGDSKKAFKLYKKALYNTKDIDVASLAALRLAQRYMDKGDIKTAFEYYKKIYEANKEFLLKDKKEAYNLAKTLADHQLYSLAIKIGEDLLKKLKKLDDLYEPLMYHLALWSYDAGEYKKAEYWLNRYLNEFPYGDYADQLNALKDKVIFEVNDSNLTAQLKRVNEIIKKYASQEIAKKALAKKVELLYKLKRYDELLEVLDTHKEIKGVDKGFKEKVLKEYLTQLIKNNKCFKACDLIKKYKITLDKKYDDKIYECAIKTKNYKIASVVCNKYLDSPDDRVFVKWMKRKIKALEGLGDYKGVVTAVDDLCRVMKKGCYEYKLKKFFALWKLKEYKKAIILSKWLKRTQDIRNIDAFIKIVNRALKQEDYLTSALYAKYIIDLQDKFNTHPYSPFVEFTYAKYTKNKKEAIKVLLNLLPRVKGEDKARAYYLLANLTGEKKYLKKCLDVKDSKLWKGLCESALSLF